MGECVGHEAQSGLTQKLWDWLVDWVSALNMRLNQGLTQKLWDWVVD